MTPEDIDSVKVLRQARADLEAERAAYDGRRDDYARSVRNACDTVLLAYRERERELLSDVARSHPERLERAVPESVNVNYNRDPFSYTPAAPGDDRADADMVGRAITAIERSSHFLEGAHQEAATVAIEAVRNDNAGAEQVLATANPHYRTAFAKVMADQRELLSPQEREAMHRVHDVSRRNGVNQYTADEARERGITLSNVTGVLVPAHLDPTITLSSDGSLNPYREIARVVPTTTNVWTGVTSAGITGGWSGAENTEVDDDTPSQASPSVTSHMADAFVPLSFQAFEDWMNAEAELMTMFVDYKSVLEEAAFTNGSGSNQPFGCVTALATTTSWVSCATNSSFTASDLFSVKQALPGRWKPRARYVMNEAYNDRIRQFGTNDGSLYVVDLTEENAQTVLGKRAHLSTTMSSALSTATNTVLVYGDWSQFVIADRLGLSVEVVANLFSASNMRPTQSRGILAHWRVGSDVVVNSAFRLLMNQGVHA